MRRRGTRVTAWTFGLLAALAGAPAADTFVVRPGGGNEVLFTSRAAMETFTGRTRQLEGALTLSPGAVGDTITVHLEVDLASLRTGKSRRDQHMRENHLETAKFPKAIFDGATVLGPPGARLEPGKPVQFEIEGTFALHGVTRRLRCKAEATYSGAAGGAGARIAFRASFPVSLPDYRIRRPEFLFLKLAETQDVRVSGVGVAAP